MKEPNSVGDILDELADGGGDVTVADVAKAFGDRSYGPFLLLPALIELTPIGTIPGVPTFLALTIAIVAMQMLLGKSHVWLPGFIENRSVSAEKLTKATKKLRGIGNVLDRWFHGRLEVFTSDAFRRLAALIILSLCATVLPLEAIPFASSGPMLAIACFGLAIMVRDGVLMVVATTLSVATAGLGVMLWNGQGAGGG